MPAIFYLQNMANLKSFCFFVLMLFTSGIHAQENALIVKTTKNLDDVLERKLSLDKKRLKNNQFSIQIFLGNYDMAQVFLDSFTKSFPEKNAKLTFETPNYKIRTGMFGSRLEGVQTLDEIRKKFPDAFLLKP